MVNLAHLQSQSTNFDLKHQEVELIRVSKRSAAVIGLRELEAFRVTAPAVPSSRHGLEAICGCTSETATN
jgi:hypothetical protein